MKGRITYIPRREKNIQARRIRIAAQPGSNLPGICFIPDEPPIGKTPRSCPATYVGFWNDIHNLFASTEEARLRGYNTRRFSFNTSDGRCPGCEGQGMKRIEMNFLPDVSVPCELRAGDRFTPETLSVTWGGEHIAELSILPP